MKKSFAQRLLPCSLATLFVFALQPGAYADPVTVRAPQGSLHGFLEIRSDDGHIVASGDTTQTGHGNLITSRTLFTFRDGSTDDETTVFSQHGSFRLITDHHIQKGPSFPHPSDVLIDARSGQVTVHSPDKDGKDEVKTDHLNLPPDVANGLIPIIVENLRSDAPETTVSMVVMTPKPRLVKLVISNRGEDNTTVAGSPHKAVHYEIKIELGGVVGVVAPIVGKAPPNIQIWTIGGTATTFAREEGPLYAEGPIMTIQLTSPFWK